MNPINLNERMDKSCSSFRNIKKSLDDVRIIDTHEHIEPEGERVQRKPDLFRLFLTHYASSDLVSAGMSLKELEKVMDSSISLEDRWCIFEPYWEKVKQTGYGRALEIAASDLYEVNGINEDNYKELSRRMEEKNQKGLYEWIIQDRSGIDVSVLDGITQEEQRLPEEYNGNIFAPVARFDDYVLATSKSDLSILENSSGIRIHEFSDLLRALEKEFEKLSDTIVGVKIGLAYDRILRFDKVPRSAAEDDFVDIYNSKFFRSSQERYSLAGYSFKDKGGRISEGPSLKQTKAFQDFMVHRIIKLAEKHNLPVQIHTGLQEGNKNIIENSKPTHLVNLFREYDQVDFDIFHGSYPYTGELASLAKNFPNVYIDMCWLHVISPYRARQALSEWLDTVPTNKIFGFGGDYIFPEGVYGHQVIARENISKVLAEKIEEGTLTEKKAITVGQKLLRKNAENFFF